MKKHYIKAVVDLLLANREASVVLKNLKAVLHRKGHEKLHAQILHGVLTELSLRKATFSSTVTVAKEEDFKKLHKTITAALEKIGGATDDAQLVIDETIIGGFIATHEGKLINRSYKEKLVSLYRAITK